MPTRDRSTSDGISPSSDARTRVVRASVVLAGVLTLTAVLAWVIASASPPSTSARPAASRSGSAAPTTTARSSAADEGSDSAATPAQGRPEALRVAKLFTDAWLLKAAPPHRLAALRPWTSERLAAELAVIDTGRLPDAHRARAPELLVSSAYAAQVRQRLSNGSTIIIDLVADPGARKISWVVDGVEPGSR